MEHTTQSYSCSQTQDLGEKTGKTPQAKPLLTMSLAELEEYLTKRQKAQDDEMTPTTITCTVCKTQIPYEAGCVICPTCGYRHCGG